MNQYAADFCCSGHLAQNSTSYCECVFLCCMNEQILYDTFRSLMAVNMDYREHMARTYVASV